MFASRVLVSTGSLTPQHFVIASNPIEAAAMREDGYASVLVKNFDYQIVDFVMTLQMSKVVNPRPSTLYLAFSKEENAKLADTNSYDGFAKNVIDRLGVTGASTYWTNTDLDDEPRPRTLGVFTPVKAFIGHANTQLVKIDLRESAVLQDIEAYFDKIGPGPAAILKDTYAVETPLVCLHIRRQIQLLLASI